MTSADYLASKQKNTLGANTSLYDWKMNSAGQDNIGKILLAILSFKRLHEKHNENYKGGILAIDELDATLYPGSQIKLLEAFRKFASQFKIQIIFTTHSLSILEVVCALQEDQNINGQINVVYLEKKDAKIKSVERLSFESIRHRLNVTVGKTKKITRIPTFIEDKEGECFLKALLKRRSSKLQCIDCTMGCGNLIELSQKKVPGFKFPNSLIVLDGDVRQDNSKMNRIKNLENIILLPGNVSPDRLIASFIHGLSDESPAWNRFPDGYNKTFVFLDYSLQDILNDRQKAKAWFKQQKEHWGRGGARMVNLWMQENKDAVKQFLNEFDTIAEKYNKALSLNF
jgi:hypothetical protein